MAEAEAVPAHLRRGFHPRKDVLNEMTDLELITRYRLDREGILMLTDLVRDVLSRPTARNNVIPPELKVVTTLRYLATGKMQQCSSDDLGPSQPTISRIIKETVYALTTVEILRRFIKFPHSRDVTRANARGFKEIAGLTGIIGVIDGTHVQILAPREYEYEYVNRKGKHSINVQVIFNHDYKFLDIVAQWPGAVHDARILRECALFRGFEGGHIPPGSHLLGDSGYPSMKWLLTPYARPLQGRQTQYNR